MGGSVNGNALKILFLDSCCAYHKKNAANNWMIRATHSLYISTWMNTKLIGCKRKFLTQQLCIPYRKIYALICLLIVQKVEHLWCRGIHLIYLLGVKILFLRKARLSWHPEWPIRCWILTPLYVDDGRETIILSGLELNTFPFCPDIMS